MVLLCGSTRLASKAEFFLPPPLSLPIQNGFYANPNLWWWWEEMGEGGRGEKRRGEEGRSLHWWY